MRVITREPRRAEMQLKLALMQCIDAEIRARYRTLEIAAEAADVNIERLSRLRNGVHQDLSLAWLLRLAERINAGIRVRVGRAPRPETTAQT